MSIICPLISCICITRGKPAMLQRVIDCFGAQSYPEKELIVVYEDDDTPTVQFIENRTYDVAITFICAGTTPKQPLGELRNMGIKKAAGEFVCQWDDDDWYHSGRLAVQYKELLVNNRHGSILTQWVVYDAVRKNAYVSNKRIWEGSILCRKEVLLLKPYENKSIGEDTPTIEYLAEENHLQLITDQPGLYIYIYHGHNTWNAGHWDYIFECSEQLPEADAADIVTMLNGTFSPHVGSLLMDEIIHRHHTREQAGFIKQ